MKPTYRLFAAAALVGVGAFLLLAFWRQQSELSRLRKAYAELEAENGSLSVDSSISATEKALALKSVPKPMQEQARPRTVSPRPAPSAAAAANATAEAQASENIPKGKGPKPWQGMKVTVNKPDRDNSLILKDTRVKAVADGLVASMKFSQSSNTPLEKLVIVVRLPKTSDARILNLEPDPLSNYANVQKRISENGKFAIFMANVRDPNAISYNLALSGPETADVRGTCGIEPFALTVNSSGTTVQQYPEE